MKTQRDIRYEDSAEQMTVTGWVCTECKRYWGNDEHMARWCCSTSQPCECGKRKSRGWTHCDDCRNQRDHERWFAKEAVEWDGVFPLATWSGQDFFWCVDDLFDYLDNNHEGELTEDVWLTSCKPNHGMHFEMSEFLYDALPEDGVDLDEGEINATVNAWIKEHGPFSWWAKGDRLDIESVKRVIGYQSPATQPEE